MHPATSQHLPDAQSAGTKRCWLRRYDKVSALAQEVSFPQSSGTTSVSDGFAATDSDGVVRSSVIAGEDNDIPQPVALSIKSKRDAWPHRQATAEPCPKVLPGTGRCACCRFRVRAWSVCIPAESSR